MHSANTLLATGEVAALPSQYERAELLRGWLHLPPPALALRMRAFDHFTQLPLFKAYGRQWEHDFFSRCRSWRDPAIPRDPPGMDLSLARAVIARF